MKKQIFSIVVLSVASVMWMFSDRNLPAYPRTETWIKSATCAASTGHFLVVCDPDRGEIPVEDVSLADDRGHTLVLSVLSRGFGVKPTISVLKAINITINFLGFALLTLIAFRQASWRSALCIVLLGTYWIGARAGPDVDAAYIGIAALAAGALIFAATEKSLLSLPPIFLLLSFVSLIREPIGLGAALSLFLVAVIGFFLKFKEPSQRIRSVLLMFAAVALMKIPGLPTYIRDCVLGTKAIGTSAHGLSHNLFLGLGGFVDNKWGIVWDDDYAAKLMNRLHPEIAYCSDAYFKEIGNLYWSYVKADPVEALRIYLIKTGRTLGAAEGLSLPTIVSLIALIGLFYYAKRKKIPLERENIFLFIGPLLFACSFIAQGILTHPAWNYIYPGPILAMICVAMFADHVREILRS